MTAPRTAGQLLEALHASRVSADIERLCALFDPQAQLRIVGTSEGRPVVITASGSAEIRTWLTMLVKSFRLLDYQRLSLLVDGERAAAHWRVQIRSKITGAQVGTELMDMIDSHAGRIRAHTEFFIPY